ncbi:MAG: TIGR01212 family radical SAM protein [Bacteroidales bacterium]|nr:TIGR01212 family radical SAM protein [Bacteroidales bacterium]
MFPWGGERRFNAYSHYCRTHFGGRIQKLPVDAGFSCPNRVSRTQGGCTYCANNAFTPSYLTENDDVTTQLENGKRFFEKRYPSNNGYFAYFQAYTNTLAPLSVLRDKIESSLHVSNIKGIIISTRPDCLPDDVLDYLSELNTHTHLTIELGVESFHNETLTHIHRGHTVECTFESFEKLHSRNIPTGAHLIFGLPNETPTQWLSDVQLLNLLHPQFVKFHQLQIFKNTAMQSEYHDHPERFHPLSADDYVQFLCDYLERLSPEIVIERFSAEVPPRYLAVSQWNLLRHDALVRKVEEELLKRESWQGCRDAINRVSTEPTTANY